MKTLLNNSQNRVALMVARLNGYLQAVSDMNDEHLTTRYWFWSDMLYLKNAKVVDVIHEYLKTSNVEIRAIDLREELEIIEAHILKNYLQGTVDLNNEKQCYVMNLHGWRIQEYIALSAQYKKENGRWVTKIITEDGTLTSIFIQIKKRLIVMDFLVRYS